MTPASTPAPAPTVPNDGPHYRPGLLARSPKAVILIAVLISLALHVALGYYFYNRPLGYIDLAGLQADRLPVRIKRASVDTFTTPTAPGGQGDHGDSLAALADTVLTQTAPPVPQAEPDLQPQLRQTQDTRPQDAQRDLDIELPPFELPDAALAELAPTRPDELGYRDSPLQGAETAPTDAATAAQYALGRAGQGTGTGTGTGPGAAVAAAALDTSPAKPETRPTPPQREPEIPAFVPSLDLEQIIPEPAEPPQPAVNLDDDFDYRVTRYQPKGETGYFRVDITAKRSLHKLRTMPKDVVYLIDTSSSVPQEWVKQAVRGVEESLPALNEGDRFNIVMFNQNPTALSTQRIQPVNAQTLADARKFLSGARSQGWTDVNAALRQLLTRDSQTDRVYMLLLISDGKPTRGVLDTRDLINLITRDNDLTAGIYCVGVGDEQNTQLLDFLAYRNKGLAVHVKRSRDAAPAIRNLMSRLRYPLIKDVSLSFVGLERGTVFPLNLPDIHQGETFSVFGRYDPQDPEQFFMRLAGASGQGPVDFTFTRNLNDAPLGDKQIARDWAFQKLHYLYSEIIRLGERPELLEQINELRRKYKLKTLY